MSTPTSTPTSTETADDFFLSLNGFDEIAVSKAFGVDISELRETPFRFLRALIFIHQRREAGAKDAEAYKTAMGMTVAAVGEYFPDGEDDADALDQSDQAMDTDAGKDDTPSA
jgi:hypothetical protein